MGKLKNIVVGSSVLLIAGFGCQAAQPPAVQDSTQAGNNASNNPVANESTPAVKATSPTYKPKTAAKPAESTPAPAPKPLDYSTAFATYYNKGLVQFVQCKSTVGRLTVKRNAPFMLDNRDDKSRTIKIQGKSYTLKPYGFAIVSAPTVGESYVTCDGGGSFLLNVEG